MRLLPWWPRMPFWMRLVRRLVREQADKQEHNDYLVRVVEDLTTKNTELSRKVETLRWRVGDLDQPPPLISDEDD